MLRCFRAAAATLDEPRLHALLQLALLPAVAFSAPSAAAVLGFNVAHASTRAVLRAMVASGFLEVRSEDCFCSKSLSGALGATWKQHHNCGLQLWVVAGMRAHVSEALINAGAGWRRGGVAHECMCPRGRRQASG